MWVSAFLRPVSLLGYCVRLPDGIRNMGCAADGRQSQSAQITPYSLSNIGISVESSFFRICFNTVFSMGLSFMSVIGLPSRSITVALSRLRTS